MPHYNIHFFPVVRVAVREVKADNPLQALKTAEEKTNLNHVLHHPSRDVEYAEEIACQAVDELDDGTHEVKKTTWFGPDYEEGVGSYDRLFRDIMRKKEVLPLLLGISDELDTFISIQMKEETHT